MHNIDNMQRKSLLKHNSAQTVLENTIESMDYQKALAYALILAIGNGADAIEITSVGYIMEEMGGISDIEKGEGVVNAAFDGQMYGTRKYVNNSICYRMAQCVCLHGNACWRNLGRLFCRQFWKKTLSIDITWFEFLWCNWFVFCLLSC